MVLTLIKTQRKLLKATTQNQNKGFEEKDKHQPIPLLSSTDVIPHPPTRYVIRDWWTSSTG